jgi:hypothetical protein
MAPENRTVVVLPDYDLPTQHDAYPIVPTGIAPRLLFDHAERFLNRVLNRLLEDLDIGYSIYVGGSLSFERFEFKLEIKMYGELECCLEVLRQVF